MASPMNGERLRVDIAQGLSHEGCGSGPRQTLARRRGPLSVCCNFSFSEHTISSPEEPLQQVERTHPERKSPRMVNGRRGAAFMERTDTPAGHTTGG